MYYRGVLSGGIIGGFIGGFIGSLIGRIIGSIIGSIIGGYYQCLQWERKRDQWSPTQYKGDCRK